jgi:hypothetical protein
MDTRPRIRGRVEPRNSQRSPYPAVTSSVVYPLYPQLYPANAIVRGSGGYLAGYTCGYTEHAFRIGCTLGVSIAIIWDDLALSLRNGKAVLRQIYARMPIATSLILRFIPAPVDPSYRPADRDRVVLSPFRSHYHSISASSRPTSNLAAGKPHARLNESTTHWPAPPALYALHALNHTSSP